MIGQTAPVSELDRYTQSIAAMERRIADLERAAGRSYAPVVTTLQSADTTTQTGGASSDFTYNTATITLTPGTWMVMAGLSLVNTVTSDAVSCGIWNNDTGALVASSTGAAGTVSTTVGLAAASAPTVMTVVANTVVRPRGRRNGVSTIRAVSSAGAPAGYIVAWRIA